MIIFKFYKLVFFGIEMGVEGAMGHFCGLHDLADGNLVEAIAGKQIDGGGQYAVFGFRLLIFWVWHKR